MQQGFLILLLLGYLLLEGFLTKNKLSTGLEARSIKSQFTAYLEMQPVSYSADAIWAQQEKYIDQSAGLCCDGAQRWCAVASRGDSPVMFWSWMARILCTNRRGNWVLVSLLSSIDLSCSRIKTWLNNPVEILSYCSVDGVSIRHSWVFQVLVYCISHLPPARL